MGNSGAKKRYSLNEGSESKSASPEDFITKVVCKENDLKDGHMKECETEEGKILVVRENGKYSAMGSKCTHYGAPLIKGVLKDGKIRCPWHGACFNSVSGDIEDFPGLDSLPCFDVSVENGNVVVKAQIAALRAQKRKKPVSKHCPTNAQTFVVVGGGAAAQSCIETLRQNGYSGKLIVITKEKHFPYDRPKLSKALEATAESLYLRNSDYFIDAGITFMHETEVTSIDIKERWVSCDSGKLMVKFDSLMIATGGKPIELDVPGSDLQNVCYLRSPEDGNYIAKNAANKSVVVVGSSFIGTEVASYLLTKAKSINVVSRSDLPFKAVLGGQVGEKIKKMLEKKGVVYHCNDEVEQLLGSKGVLTGVQLASGKTLEADLCVVGIGVQPSTGFLKDSGITLSERGLVQVDEHLATNISNVYAAGDIVEFPLAVIDSQRANICHWQMAMAHGHTAALNMLGKEQKLKSVPFFWSVICGKSFRYAGYGMSFDDVIIDGHIDDLQFVACYCKDDKVVAVCTCNRDPVAASFASDMLAGKFWLKKDIDCN